MNLRDSSDFVLCFVCIFSLVSGAVLLEDGDIESQGLYNKSDTVIILSNQNFARKVYGQKQALIVQFYNSYCGHCRAFAPKYKKLMKEVIYWKNVVKFAVIDCSVEENNDICRELDIMHYPCLRYFHENYVKGKDNIGDQLQTTDTAEKLKQQVIHKLQKEQSMGQLTFSPSFGISSYATYVAALKDVPHDVKFTFLVFENDNSTVGTEVILYLNDYPQVRVKRAYEDCELASVSGVIHTPAVVAVTSDLHGTLLTVSHSETQKATSKDILYSIDKYLKSKGYIFLQRETLLEPSSDESNMEEKPQTVTDDIVYYMDLEKTLKTALHTEIARYQILKGEPRQALINFFDVLIKAFPFKGNLREYITDLRNHLAQRDEWAGDEIHALVIRLETNHAPVYSHNVDYVGCKGSQSQYRGYSCGLWKLFHTLTVNAADLPGTVGPEVLRAMYGYIKHFFGCTECAQHFQDMAINNRIFDVKENDKAVLWLWISHNEVNLRLAGDITEDPEHKKVQFPSAVMCPTCRLARGAWNLPAVYQYLQQMYGAGHIRSARRVASAAAPAPLSNLDIGMLSLLYILSFIILIIVIKFFLTKRLHRKRMYKHGWGKV